MRKIFILTICLVGLMTSSVLANAFCAFEDREYVTAQQVVVAQEGLFAIINEEMVPVASIGQDEQGIYCVKVTWTCPRCGAVNKFWNAHCKNCGY